MLKDCTLPKTGCESTAVLAISQDHLAWTNYLPHLGIARTGIELAYVLWLTWPTHFSHLLRGTLDSHAVAEVFKPQDCPQGTLRIQLVLLAGIKAGAKDTIGT